MFRLNRRSVLMFVWSLVELGQRLPRHMIAVDSSPHRPSRHPPSEDVSPRVNLA